MGNSGIVTDMGANLENVPVIEATPASLDALISHPRPSVMWSVCVSSVVGDVAGSTHNGSGVGSGCVGGGHGVALRGRALALRWSEPRRGRM